MTTPEVHARTSYGVERALTQMYLGGPVCSLNIPSSSPSDDDKKWLAMANGEKVSIVNSHNGNLERYES